MSEDRWIDIWVEGKPRPGARSTRPERLSCNGTFRANGSIIRPSHIETDQFIQDLHDLYHRVRRQFAGFQTNDRFQLVPMATAIWIRRLVSLNQVSMVARARLMRSARWNTVDTFNSYNSSGRNAGRTFFPSAIYETCLIDGTIRGSDSFLLSFIHGFVDCLDGFIHCDNRNCTTHNGRGGLSRFNGNRP